MKKVYDNGVECLGDEWVNLSRLQGDTRRAILQIIYLDEIMNELNGTENKKLCESSPMQKCDGFFGKMNA